MTGPRHPDVEFGLSGWRCEACGVWPPSTRTVVRWLLWATLLAAGAGLTAMEDGSVAAALQFILDAISQVK